VRDECAAYAYTLLLRDAGHAVTAAPGELPALAFAAAEPFDAVLLELDAVGRAVAEGVRDLDLDRRPALIALIDRRHFVSDSLLSWQAGFDACLPRPPDPARLLAVVERLAT
jgi:DNA-binding response OmpR family regulator